MVTLFGCFYTTQSTNGNVQHVYVLDKTRVNNMYYISFIMTFKVRFCSLTFTMRMQISVLYDIILINNR